MFHFSNIKRANLRKATTSFFRVFFSNIKLQTFGGNLDYPFEGEFYITLLTSQSGHLQTISRQCSLDKLIHLFLVHKA